MAASAIATTHGVVSSAGARTLSAVRDLCPPSNGGDDRGVAPAHAEHQHPSTQHQQQHSLLRWRQPPSRLSLTTWTCAFCGCARNGPDDARCRLCGRPRCRAPPRMLDSSVDNAAALAGARRRWAAARNSGGQDVTHVDKTTPIEETVADERSDFTLCRRTGNGVQLVGRDTVPKFGDGGDCVICYESTTENAKCCGQPLCERCCASLPSSACPMCRQYLLHTRLPIQPKTSPTGLGIAGGTAAWDGEMLQLEAASSGILLSAPPPHPPPTTTPTALTEEARRGHRLPPLRRPPELRRNDEVEPSSMVPPQDLADYVESLIVAADVARSDSRPVQAFGDPMCNTLGEHLMGIDGHLEGLIQNIRQGKLGRAESARTLRLFERLRRHGLLTPAQTRRLETARASSSTRVE
eukprot:TRINITY_DN37717_c0_g1_i1.p1 TRINITY_DN37717_c0_g1~~TRINITY_DN37717_c0_g1_i1.p1  ORF type:complete len:409 (-),score=46.95 TRINITY_DN37717_c0_g1_i1:195-1421(-)